MGSSSCPLGKGTNATTCDREHTRLLEDVEAAIERVIQSKPEIFDLTREAAPQTRAFMVLDEEAYFDALLVELRKAGLCAQKDYDGVLETISVKDSNEFSEDFDVLLGDGFIRRGFGSYRQTCTPSAFPVDPDPNGPPAGSGCGKPYPPPVSRFNVKKHLKIEGGWTVDSTPLVGPNVAYCAEIGFTDGRSLCPVRPEGAVDREACEAWRVGEAADTGRIGPTWKWENEQLCSGPESGCQNHPDNQFQVYAYKSGEYYACATSGACGKVFVDQR